MYALALSCVFLAASHVFADPIPVVHNRLIRRCDNHTGTSYSSYAYSTSSWESSSSTSIGPVPGTVATSLLSNSTAGAIGTSAGGDSQSDNAYQTAATSLLSNSTAGAIGTSTGDASQSNNAYQTAAASLLSNSTAGAIGTSAGGDSQSDNAYQTPATSLLSNSTAGAIGTSTGDASQSNITYLTAASSTTPLPAGIFPPSGSVNSTQPVLNGTWGSANATLSSSAVSTCL